MLTDEKVIVIGAGPVGLVTALGLAKLGIRVLVIENNSEDVPSQWRGSTIHPPTLEIFDSIGLADHIMAGAIKVDVLQYRDLEIDKVVNFDYSVLENRVKFPFRLQYEQYKVLKLLRDLASKESNIRLAYNSEIVSVRQNEANIFIKIRNSNNETEIIGEFLVGADGSHSAVRKSLGIELDGFTYPFPTTVVATHFDFKKFIPDLAPVSYWSGPNGRLSMIKTPDIWRIAMTTPLVDVDLSTDDRGTISEPTEDFKNAIGQLLALIPGSTLADLELKQYEVYRSHQRIARQFSSGRIALAGDAAHLTTTNGGMGLNSGVQDAGHLIQAIQKAVVSKSPEALAEYSRVREEFCSKFLQPTTTLNHQTIDEQELQIRAERLDKLQRSSESPQEVLSIVSRASMLSELVI